MSIVAEGEGHPFVFETAALTDRIKQLQTDLGLENSFTNENSVGWTLRKLRLSRPRKGKNRRRWQTSRKEVDELARAYGLTRENAENAENDGNAEDEVEEGR